VGLWWGVVGWLAGWLAGWLSTTITTTTITTTTIIIIIIRRHILLPTHTHTHSPILSIHRFHNNFFFFPFMNMNGRRESFYYGTDTIRRTVEVFSILLSFKLSLILCF
jgi:hypothetical protein